MWSVSISSLHAVVSLFITTFLWERSSVCHFIRFVRLIIYKSKQTQENTSQFQNKSSNPHSEFTRFDVLFDIFDVYLTYSSNYSGYNISVLKKWANIKDYVDIWIKWCLVNIKPGLSSGRGRPLQALAVMHNVHLALLFII